MSHHFTPATIHAHAHTHAHRDSRRKGSSQALVACKRYLGRQDPSSLLHVVLAESLPIL